MKIFEEFGRWALRFIFMHLPFLGAFNEKYIFVCVFYIKLYFALDKKAGNSYNYGSETLLNERGYSYYEKNFSSRTLHCYARCYADRSFLCWGC